MTTKFYISEFDLTTGLAKTIFSIPEDRMEEVRNNIMIAQDDPTLQYSYPILPFDVVTIAEMIGQPFKSDPNIFYLLEGRDNDD